MKSHLAWAAFVLAAAAVVHLLHAFEPPAPRQIEPANPNVAYARAKLQLAEANLLKVEQMNQRVANVVSGNVVAQFRADVATARRQLDDSLEGNGLYDFANWLSAAEDDWHAADQAWKSAVAANTHNANTINATDIERLRLRAEVCRTNLDRGRLLADKPHEAQLAWRVSVLNDQVDRLREQVFRNPQPGSITYFWWY